jgi:hypothetical protein
VPEGGIARRADEALLQLLNALLRHQRKRYRLARIRSPLSRERRSVEEERKKKKKKSCRDQVEPQEG